MDFPPNSHASKEKSKPEPRPEKKVERVVTTDVIQKKAPIGRRMKTIFFGGEFKSAARYVAVDVLLPAMKNTIVDATTRGIERMVYGDSVNSRRRPFSDPRAQRTLYNSVPLDRRYSPGPARGVMLPDQPPHHTRNKQDAGDFILQSSGEADLVLERLNDIIDQYEVASLSDLKDLLGLPASFVDTKWGWSTLAFASVKQIREGYLLDLPPVEPI